MISQPNPPFDDLAIASVLSWAFEPARSGGQAVASHLNVTVHFDPTAPGGETITVQGTLNALERGHQAAPSVGAQDVHVEAGKLATEIPHKDATELLGWAPGFLLTNEGGEGHAEQIFLRGFDAREGQDIEMQVNGDVVNQVGNLHGNGYADLHFILPELVQSLRVIEGPYDPRQGNFAVAGSADYELGLTRRGLTASYEVGSYGTERALLLWGSPTSNSHNFAGVELYQTDGFGQNRDARRATALGQLEDKLGEDGLWRLTSGAYLTEYHSAGVVREDDYAARRIGFYDSYDPDQGGAATRAFVLGDLEFQHNDYTTHHQLSVTAQTLRLREDFTGFLLDQQEAVQNPHDQRGDLIDLESDAITLQEQSWMRRHFEVAGLAQELEFGLSGRLDATSGQQYRLFTLATPPYPYHKEADLSAVLGDVGLYAAAKRQARAVGRAARRRARRSVHLQRARQLRRAVGRAPVAGQSAGRRELPVAGRPGQVPRAGRALDHRRYDRPAARIARARPILRAVAVGQRRPRRALDRSVVHLAGPWDPVRADPVVRGRAGLQGVTRRPRPRAPDVRIPVDVGVSVAGRGSNRVRFVVE